LKIVEIIIDRGYLVPTGYTCLPSKSCSSSLLYSCRIWCLAKRRRKGV